MNKTIERDAEEILRRVDLKKLKGKRVLITGANGFLGQYVAAALSLVNRKNKLGIKIDTIGLSAPRLILKDVIESDPLVSYKKVDLTKPFKLGGYDYIFHAAGYAQPAKFVNDPRGTIAINIEATEQLLKDSPKATFVFFSSAEVYGDIPEKEIPVKESYNGNSSLHGPRSVYAESKRLGEALCVAYNRINSTPVKIVRISHVYGPGLPFDDHRVMSEFIARALTKGEIALMDQGRAVKTYGYITDVIAMILHTAIFGKELVYNVGGKDPVSILDLAKKIAKVTNSSYQVPKEKSTLRHIGKDPRVVRLDLSRIKKEMKKFSFTPFNEGLKRTIEWSQALK